MDIVRRSDGKFHVLLLIADGQVVPGPCMETTKRAIVEASRYPLSIIMVGVGDGVAHTRMALAANVKSFVCFCVSAAVRLVLAVIDMLCRPLGDNAEV